MKPRKTKRIFPNLGGLSRDSTGNLEIGEQWGDPPELWKGKLIDADARVPKGWHCPEEQKADAA